MSDNVIHVGDADFQAQVLESDLPVLVDFWAEWCGPCRMIGPIVDEMATTYAGRLKVVKVNVDHSQRTAAAYSIRGIPALILYRNGREVARLAGARPAADIIAFVRVHAGQG